MQDSICASFVDRIDFSHTPFMNLLISSVWVLSLQEEAEGLARANAGSAQQACPDMTGEETGKTGHPNKSGEKVRV